MRISLAASIAAACCLAGFVRADDPVIPRTLRPSRESQAHVWKDAMEAARSGKDPALLNEPARMLAAMQSGKPLGAGSGWFGPSQTRFGWKWLAKRYDRDGNGVVTREELDCSAETFAALDRDRDGGITAEDLDTSDNSPAAKQQAQMKQIFRLLDKDGDGQLSRKEWEAAFDRIAKNKDAIEMTELQSFLFPPPRQATKGQKGPPKEVMLKAFLDGDAGSPFEGPTVGESAPDFSLPTLDGKKSIRLADYRGKRPVVLIFGSFT